MQDTTIADSSPTALSLLETVRQIAGFTLVPVALLGLVAGTLAWWTGYPGPAAIVWTVATLPVLLALLMEIVVALARADIGLDIIAALSMSAALSFGEPLAANVVALMYAGGGWLERFAEGRARKEMTALLGRVARTAMRRRGSDLLEVPIESIEPGHVLLIRQGEVLPVDGHVASGYTATLDASALTGEAIPVSLDTGDEAQSGTTSVGAAFDLIATRPARDSAYAAIVRLVEGAQQSKSPMMRLADRYSLGFLAFTLLLAAAAWILGGTPERAVAVLVCATPCPLILAVPIAFISGMSHTAKTGLLVKSAGIFEAMARIKVAILDKTGTLTHGSAEIAKIVTTADVSSDDVLLYAASLDQASGHVLAAALIQGALAKGLALLPPTDVTEVPGAGIEGVVDGKRIIVGGDRFVAERAKGDPAALHPPEATTALSVAVAIDGNVAGVILLEDVLRTDAHDFVAALRAGGIDRFILASGDKRQIADAIGATVGADEVLADVTPSQKVDAVIAARRYGPTLMVGDGVNDAPALAAADVGVAMGARGSAASSETAGAVLLVDALAPLALGLKTARRTRTIAFQSVAAGIGLSAMAMIAAAFGYLPPVQGALLQEAIDVAVILNALRALR